MTPTHLLIGCGARKLDHAAPARDLYTGPLFRAARTYAEASGLPWAILSAHYGLVMPEQVIEPYDATLRAARGLAPFSAEIRRVTIGQQLGRWLVGVRPAVVQMHAGAAYHRWARQGLDLAQVHGIYLVAPLTGLEIGQRLSWYRQRRAP